jgi:hypothetical protein
MINKLKVFTLIAAFLSGCSNDEAPSLSDVEQGIKESWAECKYKEKPQVEITDMERTNGINHGETYEMFISYKIKLNNDFKMLVDGVSCPIYLGDSLVRIAAAQGIFDMKEGSIINIDTSFNMVKSENGWIQEE